MKNKLIKIFTLILSLLAITCFSLACAPSTPDNGGEGQTPSQHTHSYITNFDTLKHWEECSCGEKKDITQHTFTDGKCACGYEKDDSSTTHTHNYTTNFDAVKHWKECACGDKKEITQHSFINGKCTCGYENEDVTPTHTHSFTLKKESSKYLKTSGTCSQKAVYYYSCECGEKGNQTFEVETALTANEVFERSKNSVGEIITYKKNGSELALGSCFAYSRDGKIVTNYHVIEDAYSAKVSINGKTYTVDNVLAYDKDVDLAVLKIAATNLPALTVCAKTHAVGKQVYAFGSSKGLTATFSQGIITYADREIDGVSCVQHDAATSSGNSGGPLINAYCEVIGVHTMTIKDSQNLNLAVSVKELNNLKYGTPTTLDKLFGQTEVADTFTKIKNYIVSNGKYNSEDKRYEWDFYTSNGNDCVFKYSARYDVTDAEIEFSVFYYDYTYQSGDLTTLIIDKIDGAYEWNWIDGDSQFLMGNIYGSTFNEDIILGITYNSGFYYQSAIMSSRETASISMHILLLKVDDWLYDIGLSAYSLGFVYY